MTQVAILTPLDLADGKVKGNSFRKQILRKQTITYKGKKIAFNDALLSDIAKNFNKGAYDQVPLFFADEKNRHNEDPKRYHGELVGVELTDDGLDGIFNLTPAGRKAVKANPKLGVSARIMGGVSHADGRNFGASIRHVLATTFPRIQGMKPWEAVSLSDDDEDIEVVDLTAIGTEKKGSHAMATKTKKGRTRTRPSDGVVTVQTSKGEVPLDLSDLDDETFQGLIDFAIALDEGDVVDLDDDDEDDEDEDLDDEDESDDDDDDEEDEDEDDDTDLSDSDDEDEDEPPASTKKTKKGKGSKKPLPEAFVKNQKAARRKGKKTGKVSLSLADRLAQGEWKRRRKAYAEAGVPPHMLDLAEPILSRPNSVLVDLADDGEADASAVIEGLLDAAQGYHMIRTEMGHVDLSDEEVSQADALLASWDKEYGAP